LLRSRADRQHRRRHRAVRAARLCAGDAGDLRRSPKPGRGSARAVWIAYRFALRFFGTLLPARRASDRPIAIACLRLLTFLPLRPLRNVPRLRLCIARFTFFAAPREYFRAMGSPLTFAHVLLGEPVSTSLGHALASK